MKRIITVKNILILLLFLFFTGCTTVVKFKHNKLQPVDKLDPVTVRHNFANQIPNETQIVSSFVFQCRWRSFYSLGCLERNLAENEFVFAAMNPAGVKLFQISDKDDKVQYSCSIEQMEKLAPYADYIADDIKNIYFDDIPTNQAHFTKEKKRIVFIEKHKDGLIKYFFGGSKCYLIKKAFMKKRSWFWRLFLNDYYEVWSADFYGYKNINHKLYSEKIFYQNNEIGYQLIIRLKKGTVN